MDERSAEFQENRPARRAVAAALAGMLLAASWQSSDAIIYHARETLRGFVQMEDE